MVSLSLHSQPISIVNLEVSRNMWNRESRDVEISNLKQSTNDYQMVFRFLLILSLFIEFMCHGWLHTSSTRTRRGGSCLRFDYKTFFIYRTCTRRAPCVRALRELVVLLLFKNVTGVRPRCNATSSEHFLHTSHCTLHALHFTLHTCTSHSTAHLISNHLISSLLMSPHLTSSHLISSLLTYHLSKFFSTVFISSEH